MRVSSFLIVFIFLIGCSSKDQFIPKKVEYKKLKTNTHKELEDYTQNTLTFKDLRLVYKKKSFLDDGVWGEWEYFDKSGKSLGKFEKVNTNLAKNGDKLLLIKEKKIIKLPQLIYTATKKGNLIAIVFENNAIGVYDLDEDRLKFYKEFTPTIGVKYLSANPLFYNDLILFPLLRGNVAVVENFKFLKTIPISEGEFNNNIIFMKIVKNSLFIATPSRLILFDPNYLINYDADIKHVVSDGEYLYLFLVGGEIVKLDSNLKVIKKKNLEFANFSAPDFCKEYIYTVANGYLIKVSKNLDVNVYEGNNFDLNYPIKIDGCKIYNSNKVFLIE